MTGKRAILALFVMICCSTAVFSSVHIDDIEIVPKHTFDPLAYSGVVDVSRADGRVHAVWVRGGKIHYTVRQTTGEWPDEPEIIDTGSIYVEALALNFYNIPNSRKCVDIFVDRDDVTHMIFAEKYGSLYYMHGKPGSWSEPELVVERWHPSIYPDMVVKNGDLFLIYEDAVDHEMFFVSRLKNVWQPVRKLGPGMHGTLALGENGMIYMAYRFWDGLDKEYNICFAHMVPYFQDWTYVGKVDPYSTNPLPQLTDAVRRTEHGPYLTAGNGSIYIAWPHRTPGVDSPSPKKCELFLAGAREPGTYWDVTYGRDTSLFYCDTSAPFPRVALYSDSTIMYFNSRRTGPYFLIFDKKKWSYARTGPNADIWTMGITQCASDGRTVWIISSLYKNLTGPVDITGLTNPEASQWDWSNNNPEIYSQPDTIIQAGQAWQYECLASDLDGDNLTYKFVMAPETMTIDRYTGELQWDVTSESDPVTLVGIQVSDGRGGHGSQYFRLRVNPPEADFSAAPVSGYAPLSVQFTDMSGGVVSDWLWEFGDDSTSTEQNPQHIYAEPGTYTVRLTVSSASGSSTKERTEYITAATPPPEADFSAEPTGGLSPLEVHFTNLSSGYIDSYIWVFGDGATSTETNPVHTYQNEGVFSVSLSAAGPGGTHSKTVQECIFVADEPPAADFTWYPHKGEAPLTVSFTNTSSGIIRDYLWSFGDDSTSTEENPEHVYQKPGVYTVSLHVSSPAGEDIQTADSAVVVTQVLPVPDFDADTTTGAPPLNVSFENKTVGVSDSVLWNFGDGITSTVYSPVHEYTTIGYYTVRLCAWLDGEERSKTRESFVKLFPSLPHADFSADTTEGVQPHTVQFTDLSAGNISTWQWRFGNGDISWNQHPEYVYTEPGEYTVTLTVIGPSGIDSLVKKNYISVQHAPPRAAFSCDTTFGDKPLSVQFYDQSEGVIQSRLWDFGDGGTSTEKNPVHIYEDEGLYDVSLNVEGPGGTDLRRLEDLIHVYVDADVHDPEGAVPNSVTLYPSYPNPFNSETVISYRLPEPMPVEIAVFDVRGNRICILEKGTAGPGLHTAVWNGMNGQGQYVSTGLYIIRLRTAAHVLQRKAAFVK